MRPQVPRAPQSPRVLADRPGQPYLYQDGRLVSSTSALVVGGSGGIGQAVARACVEEGARRDARGPPPGSPRPGVRQPGRDRAGRAGGRRRGPAHGDRPGDRGPPNRPWRSRPGGGRRGRGPTGAGRRHVGRRPRPGARARPPRAVAGAAGVDRGAPRDGEPPRRRPLRGRRFGRGAGTGARVRGVQRGEGGPPVAGALGRARRGRHRSAGHGRRARLRGDAAHRSRSTSRPRRCCTRTTSRTRCGSCSTSRRRRRSPSSSWAAPARTGWRRDRARRRRHPGRAPAARTSRPARGTGSRCRRVRRFMHHDGPTTAP